MSFDPAQPERVRSYFRLLFARFDYYTVIRHAARIGRALRTPVGKAKADRRIAGGQMMLL